MKTKEKKTNVVTSMTLNASELNAPGLRKERGSRNVRNKGCCKFPKVKMEG